MTTTRCSAVVLGLVATAVLSMASPADARSSEVHLRAGAEPAASDVTTVAYGVFGDRHLLCDWDGDGDATLGVYRAATATWYIRQSPGGGDAQLIFRYGRPASGDDVLCGDWDGNGTDTPGVFRSADNAWHLRNSLSSGPAQVRFRFGRPGLDATGLAGDWDGDGDDTPGIFRPLERTWLLRNSTTAGAADLTFDYGQFSFADAPLVGDWDGNGTDTPGVFRRADAVMHLRNSNDGGSADWSYRYGASPSGPEGVSADRPLAGDWDGDGRDEPVLSREFRTTPTVTLNVRHAGGSTYIVEGRVIPGREVRLFLNRFVGRQGFGVTDGASRADGTWSFRLTLAPGTYFFRASTMSAGELTDGQSRTYGLVVPNRSGRRLPPAPPEGPPIPGNDLDCDDFPSRADAQSTFDIFFPWFGDIYGLDPDGDHTACG